MIEVLGMSGECALTICVVMTIFTLGLWWDPNDDGKFCEWEWGWKGVFWPITLPIILGIFWGKAFIIFRRWVKRETAGWGK